MRHFLVLGLAALLTAPASAAMTLDGSIAGDNYGAPVAVQTVQTQFGDNVSELNAAYGKVWNDTLFLTLTGNLEGNFNKLNIFIDSQAGGQNTIGPDADAGGTNPNNDNWADNYSGVGSEGSGNGNGFTFDAGFEADYMIIVRQGGSSLDLDFATIGGGGSAFENAFDVFSGTNQGSAPSALPNGVGIGFDNSNVAGIAGGTGPADAAAAVLVETGIELAIPLSAIGSPVLGDLISVTAHVNGSNHDFLSNQSLGGYAAPQDNLGGDGAGGFNNDVSLIDLNNFAGPQFFVVPVTAEIPEPASFVMTLLALSAAGAMGMRRRLG